jgi:hypothetical protein
MQNNSGGTVTTSVPVAVVPKCAQVPVLEDPHQRAERAVRDTLGEVAAFAKLASTPAPN